MRTPFVPRSAPPVRRQGFTLVELLAVIAILSILMALIIPAIMNARRSGIISQVKVEMGSLNTMIQNFKQDFGMEPPSFIRLFETGTAWTTVDSNVAREAIRQKSLNTVTRMWPQINFTSNNWDFNLDGDSSDEITLFGSECLVFFLGGPTTWIDADSDGIYDTGETVIQVNGFSRNPANPFGPMSSGAGNRQGPYFQFPPDRLVASTSNANFYGYADPLSGARMPYLYASSNEGTGYNEDSSGVATDFGAGLTYYYRQGAETATVPPFTSPFWNRNSFQIISAGFDRSYGTGGPYTKATANNQLFNTRDPERDNITNFSDGVLAP